MKNAVRIGLVAAAALVIAFLGVKFLLPGSNVGGPDATPTPNPTATAEPTPAPSPIAYEISIPEISGGTVTLLLPSGWSRGGWYASKTDSDAHVSLYPVENVYGDPCQWEGSLPDPPVGPTVDDLATALSAQPMRDATASDVTLGGYSGKLVRMSVPVGINFADCDSGQFASWSEAGSDLPSRYHQGPGQLDDIYILDVEGVRVIIDVSWFATTPAAELAELEEVVATLTIQP